MTRETETPEALVCIARAARLANDRALERAARRQLVEQFGIEISFRREPRGATR